MIYTVGQPYIEINSQCNMSCVYCYHNNQNSCMLSVGILKDIFQQLKERGVPEIKISGGEPLLHPDFGAIILMLKRMGFNIELVTNGTLINNTNAGFIASMIDKLVISLDSHDSNVNEETRPAGYDSAIHGIEALFRVNYTNMYIGAVVTKKNRRDFESFTEWCLKYNIKGLIFESIHREGKAKPIFDDYLLEYSDYLMCREQLIKLKNKSTLEISSLPDFGGGCMLIEDVPIIRPRIDYEGNVYLCRSFLDKEMSVGNIYQDCLLSLFENEKTNRLISALKERQNRVRKCHACFLSGKICAGGCAAQAYNRTGHLNEVDDLCEWRIRNALDSIMNRGF